MVENDQNNRTAFWERVSDVLNQYERSLGTVDINSLEIVRVRMEYIILALQQILPLWLGNRPLACVLEETLNNFRTLCLHWNCNLCQSRNGQGVALYCLVPNVKRSNRVGRPVFCVGGAISLLALSRLHLDSYIQNVPSVEMDFGTLSYRIWDTGRHRLFFDV